MLNWIVEGGPEGFQILSGSRYIGQHDCCLQHHLSGKEMCRGASACALAHLTRSSLLLGPRSTERSMYNFLMQRCHGDWKAFNNYSMGTQDNKTAD